MLGTYISPNSVVEKVVAGNDANAYIKQLALGPNGGGVCTGTNDDVVINAAVNSLPSTGSVLKLVGSFVPSQMIRNAASRCVLDLTNATLNIPSTWAASGRAVIQLGPNHVVAGTISGGSGVAPTFTNTGGGSGILANDQVYIQSTGTFPGGYNNSTPYYVVNLNYTGYGSATWQLATSPSGTPLVATSAGSGTFSMSGAVATYSSVTLGGTGLLTILGSSPVQIAKGSPVYCGAGTIPTGFVSSAPWFLSPQGSNTYKVYLDAALTVLMVGTTNGAATGFNLQP